jgi:hypothetical protein
VQRTTDVERLGLFSSTIAEFRVRAETAMFASDVGARDGIEGFGIYEIARSLSTPLEYFFEGFEQDERQPLPHQGLLLDDIA